MPLEQRAIIHLDLDAFFASVEVVENPALKGKPVLVGGRPQERGVVAAASYEARAYGARSAMPMYRALQLCPQAIVLPARHSLYGDYSRRVMAILHQASPQVEQISIDEAYLDLTQQVSAWDDAVQVARTLQARVKDEIGLSSSLGVAANKLVSKVASEHGKPGGLVAVRPGEEQSFLAPLPVRVLWGVGQVTERELLKLNVRTVSELAQVSEETLRARFGKRGLEMAQQARGIDERPVITEHELKSISEERTFVRDVKDAQVLRKQAWELSQGVAWRLKSAELAAGTVTIKLRYADFTTLTRQMKLAAPTDDEQTICRAALALLKRAWDRQRAVRLLGVGAQQLTQPIGQLSLF